VERQFVITPRVKGQFSWKGRALVFRPSTRFEADTRYGVTILGAHDRLGNELSGDISFSFITRQAGKVVRIYPRRGAANVTDSRISIYFSRPMDREATASALRVTNLERDARVRGKVEWSHGGRSLTFRPASALARGARFEVRLTRAASDLDGNQLSRTWTFRTKAPPRPPPAPAPKVEAAPQPVGGPPAPADLQSYALWQVNQARARYGFGAMRLDGAVSQVAADHAWDMLRNGYFSHIGLDGSTISSRLRAGGVSFSWSGENICYRAGLSVRATLDWCHSIFMSEPYPGYANHIGNILSPNYNRLGVGIAASGGKVYVVWDFAG
jgi:uncharacterized protein YkwD